MKNWLRSGRVRLVAAVLLAAPLTGCIVLPFGGGHGHRGHRYNNDSSGRADPPQGHAPSSQDWRAPDTRRGR